MWLLSLGVGVGGLKRPVCHLGLALQVMLLLLVFLRRQTPCLKAIRCFSPLVLSPFYTNMMELIAKDQHADIVKNRLKMLLVETDDVNPHFLYQLHII